MDKKHGLSLVVVFTSTLLAGSGVQAQNPVRAEARRTPAKAAAPVTAAISPGLQKRLAKGRPNATAGVVIVAFRTQTGLAGVPGLQTLLTQLGITPATRFESLGMISAVLTASQVNLLASNPAVRSLTNNYALEYNLHQARVLCGVDRLRADSAMAALNGGKVIDGAAASQFSVAVIDSGIDTTSLDLPFDRTTSLAGGVPTTGKVIQNVQVAGDDVTGSVTYSENQVNNDSVGHGTHCSGIVGGTGAYSRTTAATAGPGTGQTEDFSGVAGRFTGATAADAANFATASGVKIVGLGSGAGLFILDALGGFEYVINNQVKYNIKVTSNSYGSTGVYNPDDPLSIAIKNAYDHGITNVFAAGNSGPGSDTISSNAKSPYVICVAAGTKEGGLASFSSRGLPTAQRTGDAVDAGGNHYNPNLFNLTAITAPGTGREFLFDAPYDPASASTTFVAGVSAPNPDTVGKKFYSDIISTRSKAGTAASGLNDQEFPTPYQGTYTMISGTSMACPFVAGSCALLLSLNPSLTPDQVKSTLQTTATHLPDYRDHQVGAGYLNVYAAVDKVFNPGKGYLPFNRLEAPYASSYDPYVTQISSGPLASPGRPTGYPPTALTTGAGLDEDYTLEYQPNSTSASDYASAKAKAATGTNAYAFLVDANLNGTPNTALAPQQKTASITARIQFAQGLIASQAGGNTLGLLLWAPDGTMYSSGIALPVEDAPNREVVVNNPKPGLWVAELRGIRGLAAVPVTPPTGVGVPDTVTGQIFRQNNTVLNPPTDIDNIPQKTAIQAALLNRYFDQVSSGVFNPSAPIANGDFALMLADNVPLRQSIAAGSGVSILRIVEAAAQNGSTLRDWDFTPAGVLQKPAKGYSSRTAVTRLRTALAFVRSLGLDAEAQHLAGTTVKVNYQGTKIPVTDLTFVQPVFYGYLQLAVNRGLISFTPVLQSNGTYTATLDPTTPITRADLAVALVNFRALFPLGNSLDATELTPQAP